MNIKQLIGILKWLGRLPLTFSLFFIALSGFWLVLGYGLVAKNDFYIRMEAFLRGYLVSDSLYGIQAIGVMTDAVINIIVIVVGLLLAYDMAVLINFVVFRFGVWVSRPKKFMELTPVEPVKQNMKKSGRKIGIILAGGGAKGSYQAGAMRAIHEYLESKGALENVCMIAGTSIGSWNALFWLAGLIKTDESGESGHHKWWNTINAKSIINPGWYVPFATNAFFSTEPWEVQFERIFCDNKEIRDRVLSTKIHFYLTRTNVGSGKLEFVTNNPDSKKGIKMTPLNVTSPYEYTIKERCIERNLYEVASNKDASAYFQTIKNGVFASMDLPPMFPYRYIDYEYFEDGGVIDNLPVRFGVEVEKCDLLFVIPLNSDFEEEVNTNSIVSRLYRVMSVRQGALERNALNMVKLYNAIVEVRGDRLDSIFEFSSGSSGGDSPNSKSRRKSKKMIYADPWFEGWEGDEVDSFYKKQSSAFKSPTRVFAVCPRKSLIIDTPEFWKTKESGEAFQLMYEATRDLLAEKDPLNEEYVYGEENNVVLHLISKNKDITEDHNI